MSMLSCAYSKQGLLTAIRNSNTGMATEIIEKRQRLVKAEYKTSTIKNITPLMLAAKHNNRELAEALIKSGADINARDQHAIGSYSPLEYAAYYNSPAVADLLIENGAKLEEKNDLGQTTLILSILMNSADTAELLLRKGADPNGRDDSGNTPLMFASTRHHLHALVNLLIRYGADVNAENDKGRTPLMRASFHNIPDIMQTLIMSGARVDERDKKGMTALMTAASVNYQSTDAVRILVRSGADVNALDDKGRTALMHNIMKLHEKDFSFQTARLLLVNGAHVNIQNLYGWTVLNYAIDSPCREECMERKFRMVDYILRNRAGVRHRDTGGKTVLHQLMTLPERFKEGSRELEIRNDILILLLKRRAPVNAQDDAGSTPLSLASFWNDVSAMEILIRYGARVDIRDKRGHNPLMNAASTDSLEAVALLLKRKSGPNAGDETGLTPLMVAAENDSISVARLLIRLGADLNSRDKPEGRSALMKAVIHSSKKVFDLLIERGAEINVGDREGRTPLMMAINPQIWQEYLIRNIQRSRTWQVRKTGTASLHIIRTLLENGARVDVKDRRGCTVTDYLKLTKNRKVVDIIQDFMDDED